jgi:gliding motility-associated-like protein
MFSLNLLSQSLQNPPEQFRIVAVSSADDKVQSISNEIELYHSMQIHFPTAFTPNKDGLNDTFGPLGEGIEEYKLVVYSKWGEILFSSERVTDKWDGNHKGKKVPFGVYHYEVLAYGKEFGEVNMSGSVALIN